MLTKKTRLGEDKVYFTLGLLQSAIRGSQGRNLELKKRHVEEEPRSLVLFSGLISLHYTQLFTEPSHSCPGMVGSILHQLTMRKSLTDGMEP